MYVFEDELTKHFEDELTKHYSVCFVWLSITQYVFKNVYFVFEDEMTRY